MSQHWSCSGSAWHAWGNSTDNLTSWSRNNRWLNINRNWLGDRNLGLINNRSWLGYNNLWLDINRSRLGNNKLGLDIDRLRLWDHNLRLHIDRSWLWYNDLWWLDISDLLVRGRTRDPNTRLALWSSAVGDRGPLSEEASLPVFAGDAIPFV
jgi:hypothetical protein